MERVVERVDALIPAQPKALRVCAYARVSTGKDAMLHSLSAHVRFPLSESELFAKLGEIHAVEGRDAAQSALVTEVYWPEEFSMLKDRFANLDELNYLGKRMESFDTLEYDQFLIGISKLDSKDVKDLINLTFNLNHFTLCQDVSSYGKIGREYVLNTEGAVPAHDEDDPKYATIGKDLIDRGLAQITERGLLIYNPFDELEEVYDGHTFPEYYYNNSLLSRYQGTCSGMRCSHRTGSY